MFLKVNDNTCFIEREEKCAENPGKKQTTSLQSRP